MAAHPAALEHSPLSNPDIAPIPGARRTWNWWHYCALWIGMSVSPADMCHSRRSKRRSSASPLPSPVKPRSADRAKRGTRVHWMSR